VIPRSLIYLGLSYYFVDEVLGLNHGFWRDFGTAVFASPIGL